MQNATGPSLSVLDEKVEWGAFDSLPKSIRDALNGARLKWSALSALNALQEEMQQWDATPRVAERRVVELIAHIDQEATLQ